jgi:branched-chain amino acid transport system permease protein
VSTETDRPSAEPAADAPADAAAAATSTATPESARRRGVHDKGSLAVAVVVGAALILWAGNNAYRYSLMQTAAAYALIGVGVYIPFIMGGSLSLAYAAYASIGGYSVALIADKTSLPVVVGWVIGPLAAGFAAVVLGQLTRRLSGLYLAAITYLFAQAFQSWLNSAPGITGGEAGIGNLRPTALFGWIPGHRGQIVLAVILVVLVGFVIDRMRLSPWGVSLRAMKEVPEAVEATGIRVPMVTLVALGLGAAVAAIGGALFTSATAVITPSTFTLNLIFLAVFMSLLGGQGTPWGAIAGAVLIVELTLNVPFFATSGSLLVAAVVLLVMLAAPNGVLGIIDTGRRSIMRLVGGRRPARHAATGEDGAS